MFRIISKVRVVLEVFFLLVCISYYCRAIVVLTLAIFDFNKRLTNK